MQKDYKKGVKLPKSEIPEIYRKSLQFEELWLLRVDEWNVYYVVEAKNLKIVDTV